MATPGVPSGTILAVHLQKCSHLSIEIRVMQKKKKSFSTIKQLMPAHKVNNIIKQLMPALKVNNYDVHLKCRH